MSKIGPFNRFFLWLENRLISLDAWSSEFGKKYALVSLFSRLDILKSPKLIGFLSKNLDKKTTPASALRLSITDNSSLLYYSKNTGLYLPKIRRWDLVVPTFGLIFCHTWAPAFLFSFAGFLYQPLAISVCRLFVVRMDLIPHMEVIIFHKVGLSGTSRVEVVPIKNLVKISPEHSKHEYYFRMLGGVDLLFKDTESGEEYAFEKHGTWIDENLKHSLIN
jgi:hypothetical protein